MTRVLHRYAFLALVLPVFLPASGWAEDFGDIGVNAAPPWQTHLTSHGYGEIRFDVVNRSSRETHTVELSVEEQWGHYHRIGRLQRKVVLGPSASARVSLFRPPLPLQSAKIRIRIDGRGSRDLHTHLGDYQMNNHYGGVQPRNILVSRSLSAEQFERQLTNAVAGGSSGRHQPSLLISRAETEMAGWSDRWLAYTPFDGVFMRRTEWDALPADTREALWQYAECGGLLALLGEPRPLERPFLFRAPPVAGVDAASFQLLDVGYGRCLLIAEPDVTRWTEAQRRAVGAEIDSAQRPWRDLPNETRAAAAFPVAGKLTLPIRGFLTIMLVYAALIGPALLYFLARWNRRIWLLWIVPSLSALACAAIVIYALFSEGITAKIRLETVTLLDEATHRATTLGMLGYYCPLAPAGGLHFSPLTELTPLVDRHGRGEARAVNWNQDQHFQSGWLAPRIPATFLVRKSEMRRERVQVLQKEGADLRIVNGLGADVDELWLADRQGAVYRGRAIKAGQQAVLERQANQSAMGREPDAYRRLFLDVDGESRASRVVTAPVSYLKPGLYVAHLAATPFVETGLNGRGKLTARAVVIGAPADADAL